MEINFHTHVGIHCTRGEKNDLEIKMFAWGMVAMILIPAIDRQRPVCLCEIKASKVYIIS